jgi:hypothetical protein
MFAQKHSRNYRSVYLSVCLSVCLSMALQPFVGPWPPFSFLILYRVGRTPWTGNQPVARPLPTHRTAQTQNKRTQTSKPWVGFEPTIPAFRPAKTVRAFDLAATVIGCAEIIRGLNYEFGWTGTTVSKHWIYSRHLPGACGEWRPWERTSLAKE